MTVVVDRVTKLGFPPRSTKMDIHFVGFWGFYLFSLPPLSPSRTLRFLQAKLELRNLAIRDPGLQHEIFMKTFEAPLRPGSRISSFLRPGFSWRKLTFRDDEEL